MLTANELIVQHEWVGWLEGGGVNKKMVSGLYTGYKERYYNG